MRHIDESIPSSAERKRSAKVSRAIGQFNEGASSLDLVSRDFRRNCLCKRKHAEIEITPDANQVLSERRTLYNPNRQIDISRYLVSKRIDVEFHHAITNDRLASYVVGSSRATRAPPRTLARRACRISSKVHSSITSSAHFTLCEIVLASIARMIDAQATLLRSPSRLSQLGIVVTQHAL